LDKPILAQDLDQLSSAVILKVDKADEEKSSVAVKERISNESSATNGTANRAEKINTPVKSIGGDGKLKRFVKPALIVLGVLGLIVAGYFIIKANLLKPKIPSSEVGNQITDTPEVAEDAQPDTFPQDKEIQGELSKKLDEANKVRRVEPLVFYDISITDAKVSPTDLAQGQKYLAVSDAKQGKIYISAKDVTKFEELPQLFPGVKNLQFDGDTLIFTDNEGVKFYALATKSVNKSYLADETYTTLGPASEYLGFTYAVTGDKLVKFTKTGIKLTGALWSQKEEFTNAVSMDIDGSIYVLFVDGSLEKYTAGTKADFSIVGLDKPVQKPLKVVTNADFKQIYVADGEEGRIIAFDEDGVLDFQLKPELGSEWTTLKSFDISSDEKTFYILSGTKVLEFKL
jgi:hypothetical protein